MRERRSHEKEGENAGNTLARVSSALVPLSQESPENRAKRVLARLFSQKSDETVRAYAEEIARFGAWLADPIAWGHSKALTAHARVESRIRATNYLFQLSRGDANDLVGRYRDAHETRGSKPPTVNRSLAAIRMLVKAGRALGAVDWTLDVPDVSNHAPMRRGPAFAEVQKLLGVARLDAETEEPRKVRNYAILRFLTDLGLRQGSVRTLELEHVDLRQRRILVRMKGHGAERSSFLLPEPTLQALQGWLAVRGEAPGYVFYGLHPGSTKSALASKSVWRIIQGLAGTYPHAFRHTAITAILKKTGSLHVAMHFARHLNPKTTVRYDDSAQETADDAARALADQYGEE